MNTLVVPTHLRSNWDSHCLERLVVSALQQAELHDVIVIDDASPLPTPKLPSRVVRLRLEGQGGPAKARNAGIEWALAHGASNILMADHDCVLQAGWATSFERHLAMTGDGAAGGVTRALGRTVLDRFHDLNGTLNGRWLLPARTDLLYAPTCNFAMRADVARAHRFDERFPTAAGEDVELCLRIRRNHRIGLCREALVLHDYGYRSSVSGLPRFIRTFMKYKAANHLLWDLHAGLDWRASESIPSEGE